MIQRIVKIVKKNINPDGSLSKILNALYTEYKKYFVSWEPSLNMIELEITSYCSLACHNCNRSVRQAPTSEHMSLEQINKFVQESLDLNYVWNTITIMGGEPTLHPNLWEIIARIKKYKDKYNDCRVRIATNGYGPVVNNVLIKMPDWVVIYNSSKQSNKQIFSSYNIAPIDLIKYRKKNFIKGCPITHDCGLGLNRYGYYCCGAGASVDRIFAFNVGLHSLSLVNRNAMSKQLKLLCQYCGHFKDIYGEENISEDKLSPSWEKAYNEYRKNKPKLPLY